MDTSDAALSRRPIEDKLRILKDPHAGAFGVIMLGILFVLQFAVLIVVSEKGTYLLLFIVIPVISRCCGALSILCLKPMAQSNYASMFRKNTKMPHISFVIFVTVFVLILSCVFARIYGLIVIVSVIVGFTGAMFYVYRDMKGVSGDLAGFCIVIGELCGLIAMAVI